MGPDEHHVMPSKSGLHGMKIPLQRNLSHSDAASQRTGCQFFKMTHSVGYWLTALFNLFSQGEPLTALYKKGAHNAF